MYAAADDRTAPYVPERTAVVTSRRRMPMQGRMSPGRITTEYDAWPTVYPFIHLFGRPHRRLT